MNTLKPKLFLFGGCDLHDIAKNDLLQRDFNVIDFAINKHEVDNSNLDIRQSSFPEMGTSVMSLYTNPGPVAQRMLETLATSKKRDMIVNRTVYNEIAKFPYMDFYKKHAGPNDYLLISFSPEIYTKCVVAGEIFTCLPSMTVLSHEENKLHWIYKEYLQKEEYLMPFDTKENIETTSQVMADFARDLYEIFQDRVLLVKTHFSNFVVSSDFKVKKINPGPDHLWCYRQTKIISDPADHKYAERLSMIIMNRFINRYNSDLNLIRLNEPVFIDGNHRWGGATQFHLDAGSRTKIAKLIREQLAQKIIGASAVNNG